MSHNMGPTPLHFLLLTLAGWMNRHQQNAIEYLMEENRVLREHLGPKRLRFTDQQRRRLALKAKVLGRKTLQQVCTLATPDTIMRWYRRLVAQKYDGSKLRKPPTSKHGEVKRLALKMTQENKTWGYLRIVGALQHLGFKVARSTVARWLAEAGIDPAPTRSKRTSWSDFLRAHWGTIVATDFFTVEVLTWQGIVRYHVMFVIDLKTRLATIAGVSRDPDEQWTMQVARNLLDAVDGFLLGKTHIILDRDPVFSKKFRRFLADAGVKPVRLPPFSPDLNAYSERFAGSVRRECLDHIIPIGEQHLRRVLREYVDYHYRYERPHQGLNNEFIEPTLSANDNAAIVRSSRLGGLLSYYHRRGMNRLAPWTMREGRDTDENATLGLRYRNIRRIPSPPALPKHSVSRVSTADRRAMEAVREAVDDGAGSGRGRRYQPIELGLPPFFDSGIAQADSPRLRRIVEVFMYLYQRGVAWFLGAIPAGCHNPADL